MLGESTTEHLHVTCDGFDAAAAPARELVVIVDEFIGGAAASPGNSSTALHPSATQSLRVDDHHEHTSCWFAPLVVFRVTTVIAVCVVFTPHASVELYVVMPFVTLVRSEGIVTLYTTVTVGSGHPGPPLRPPGPISFWQVSTTDAGFVAR